MKRPIHSKRKNTECGRRRNAIVNPENVKDQFTPPPPPPPLSTENQPYL